MKAKLTRAINVFLDTTPRQWIHYWLDVFNLRFDGWQDFSKKIQAGTRSLSAYTIYGSALFHTILLVAAVIVSDQMAVQSSEGEEITLEDLKLDTHGEGLASPDVMEITGVYYFDKESKKKKVQKNALDSLLSELKKTSGSRAQRDGKSKSKNFRELKLSDLKRMNIDWSKVSADANNKRKNTGNIEKELNNHLAQYNGQFRQCYERSLLKDPSLNAKVEFKLRVGANRNISKSDIQFVGVGTPEVKSELRGCLQKVTQHIKLPQNSKQLLGKQLKFFVVLNSWK